MAGALGFEPRISESESDALPLGDAPIYCFDNRYFAILYLNNNIVNFSNSTLAAFCRTHPPQGDRKINYSAQILRIRVLWAGNSQ